MDGEQTLTDKIIGCALIVHKELGPGLLESSHETALCIELATSGLRLNGRFQSRCNTAGP
jgi:GxxExxY protein